MVVFQGRGARIGVSFQWHAYRRGICFPARQPITLARPNLKRCRQTLRTYDHMESDAFRAPVNEVASQLLRNGSQRKIDFCKPLATKRLVSAEGIEPSTY